MVKRVKDLAQHSKKDIRGERLLAGIDMMEFGLELMRQNIARRMPNATSAEQDAELAKWLSEEPGTLVGPVSKYGTSL